MDEDEVREQLREVLEALRGEDEWGGVVAFYEFAAMKLWAVARRLELAKAKGLSEGWSWRYVQGVEKGTLKGSKAFGAAVRALGEELDGRQARFTGLVEMRVLARPGAFPEGSVVLGAGKVCRGLGCTVRFVPRVPWQEFCSRECRVETQKFNRR